MDSEELSESWAEDIKAEYLPLMEGRDAPSEAGTLILSPSTGSGSQNLAPSLSPDGQRLVFMSEKDLFSFDLFLAEVGSGKVKKKISNSATSPHFDALRFVDSSGSWSWDGTRLAYVVFADGDNELILVDSDDGDIQNRVAIEGMGAIQGPSWSPDGTRLAFSSFRTGGWEVFVVEMDCLAAPESCPDRLTQITNDDNANILPVWSPDGTRFAFNSKASGNWDIYTMAINGTDIRPVTTHPENDLSPTWSPDGSQIAFESNRDGNVEVYVVNADGTGTPRNISNLSWANDHGPAWTPDGQQLIFYSNREGNWDLFATSLDGQTVINLTQTPERDEQTPAWRP